MKTILTTSISDPNIQQPFTGKSLTFLQDNLADVADGISKFLVGDRNYTTSDFYVVSGLRDTGTPPVYAIAEGWIFYNGELYYCSGYAGNPANDVIGTITTTYDATIDPVTFTDGVARSVHQVKTIVLSDGVLGSGDIDYVDLIFSQDGFYRMFAQGEYSGSTAAGATVTPLSSSELDPNSWLNGATGRFTPLKAGYYEVNAHFRISVPVAAAVMTSVMFISKNGSSVQTVGGMVGDVGYDNNRYAFNSHIVYMNGTTDYLELTIVQDVATACSYFASFNAKRISE
jgi:hypothetical protein